MMAKTLEKVFTISALITLLQISLMAKDLIGYVNPFIGTSNSGNTYPNAVAPLGMISVGAQNDDFVNKPPHHAVSYTYGGTKFYGISHTNLSGVGCPDSGSLVFFPQTGTIDLEARFWRSVRQ
ncbi:MAG: hypothetical protein IPG22_07095 [Acidobacteria bacterium]|nr:hypothetical protein [Acidobacteriota bacterium]